MFKKIHISFWNDIIEFVAIIAWKFVLKTYKMLLIYFLLK